MINENRKGVKIENLGEHGLLWLINATVFHPRGFSLGYEPMTGNYWLFGDGKERFSFMEDGGEKSKDTDDKFRQVQELFSGAAKLQEREASPSAESAESDGLDGLDKGESSFVSDAFEHMRVTGHSVEAELSEMEKKWDCKDCEEGSKYCYEANDGTTCTEPLHWGTDDNPNDLEETRCGFANDRTHRPHEMTITGVWPRGVPNRWCVGGKNR